MITISRIEIKGFFDRGDFVWNLDPTVNILGGKNGSGKTSIFRCCYDLLSKNEITEGLDRSFYNLFESVCISFSSGWSLIWKRVPAADTKSYLEYSQLWFENAIRVVDNLGVERNFEELRKEIQVCYLNSFEQRISQAREYEKLPSTQSLDDPILLDLMIKDQINLRNTLRSKAVERLFKISKDNTKSAIELADYLKQSDKIYTSLARFFKGYAEPFEADFNFVKNGDFISFNKLSMGEKQILLLLLMISNTEESPCIFFMDEPDLSMHIDWKEILISELHELNPNMQIILSTHAPSVITGWLDRVKEVEQLVSK